MKTSTQFCEIGALLYGASWQAQISRDLNLDPRRIAQWKAGVRPVPQGVWADLKVIADRRKLEVKEAVQLIEKSKFYGELK